MSEILPSFSFPEVTVTLTFIEGRHPDDFVSSLFVWHISKGLATGYVCVKFLDSTWHTLQEIVYFHFPNHSFRLVTLTLTEKSQAKYMFLKVLICSIIMPSTMTPSEKIFEKMPVFTFWAVFEGHDNLELRSGSSNSTSLEGPYCQLSLHKISSQQH